MREVIIIGSGPAGLTAGVYTARANLRPLLIEGAEAGGQLMLTTTVENFPGFSDGILGPELIGSMRSQAERFGTEFVQSHVKEVHLSSRPFRVVTDEAEFRTKALIVATGASARLLGLRSERQLMGHGVSTCATCDGFFFRGKPIAVVGGGDSAIEEAIYLTRFASKVTVVHRRNTLRASKIMQDKAFANPKIEFRWNSMVEEVKDVTHGTVSGLVLKDVLTGELSELQVEGLFVAIGHTPNTGLLVGQLEMDSNGYLLTQGGSRTNVPGVFAAGDVQDSIYRQAITAAGSGCMAALDAERWLENEAGAFFEAEPATEKVGEA